MQRKTWLARAIEQERRINSMVTLPSILEEPLEVTSLEDEIQQWVDE